MKARLQQFATVVGCLDKTNPNLRAFSFQIRDYNNEKYFDPSSKSLLKIWNMISRLPNLRKLKIKLDLNNFNNDGVLLLLSMLSKCLDKQLQALKLFLVPETSEDSVRKSLLDFLRFLKHTNLKSLKLRFNDQGMNPQEILTALKGIKLNTFRTLTGSHKLDLIDLYKVEEQKV